MVRIRNLFLTLFLAWFLISSGFCADDKPVQPKPAEHEKPAELKKAAEPEKPLTRADKLKSIQGNLENLPEILSFVPGIKKEADAAGKATYTYQGKKIEDLDDEQLGKLYARVGNEGVRLRTERLNRQLDTIRRAEQVNRQNRQLMLPPRVPTPPYQPPKIPQIPQTPKIPKTTQQG